MKRCRNINCTYLAAAGRDYCCGTCQNAAIAGEAGYQLHGDETCERVTASRTRPLVKASYAKDPWGRRLAIIMGSLLGLVILLFVGAALLGAR